MTICPARARSRGALARWLTPPLLVLVAGCGGPATAPSPEAEPPSPFADCSALTTPAAPGSGDRASAGPSTGSARPVDVPAPSGAAQLSAAAQPAGAAEPSGAARLSRAANPSRAADLPELTLPCFTGGQAFRLTALRGPAVLNLWGSWCEPCRAELPAVQRLADRTAGRLHVIGVDTFDTRTAGASFAADNGIRLTTLYDRDKQLMSALGVASLPATVFVDGSGATYVHRGRPLDDAALTDLTGRHTGVTVRR